MRKIITIGAVLAGLVGPASAAEYWVVKDTATQTCSVVEQDQKPTGSKAVVVGNAYQSRDAAENAMRGTMVACGGQD